MGAFCHFPLNSLSSEALLRRFSSVKHRSSYSCLSLARDLVLPAPSYISHQSDVCCCFAVEEGDQIPTHNLWNPLDLVLEKRFPFRKVPLYRFVLAYCREQGRHIAAGLLPSAMCPHFPFHSLNPNPYPSLPPPQRTFRRSSLGKLSPPFTHTTQTSESHSFSPETLNPHPPPQARFLWEPRARLQPYLNTSASKGHLYRCQKGTRVPMGRTGLPEIVCQNGPPS
jgi:hypothetical protein